jgi:hypothetical protein
MDTLEFKIARHETCRLIKRSRNYMVVELRSHPLFRCFGIPFLVAGIGLTTAPLWESFWDSSNWYSSPWSQSPMSDSSEGPTWWLDAPLFVGFGLLFTLVGMGIMFPGSDLILDRGRETVSRRWRSPIWRFGNRTRSLNRFTSIILSKKVLLVSTDNQGKHETGTCDLAFHSADGIMEILTEIADCNQVREIAEEIAEFTSIPLKEKTLRSQRNPKK